MNKSDLALNKQQCLICRKNKAKQTKGLRCFVYSTLMLIIMGFQLIIFI